MLATMVMMGINRIVVTKGKISANVNGVERRSQIKVARAPRTISETRVPRRMCFGGLILIRVIQTLSGLSPTEGRRESDDSCSQ
jgi:hypothetical protein